MKIVKVVEIQTKGKRELNYKLPFCSVYMIKCKVNKKRYITSSIDTKKTLNQHWKNLRDNKHRNKRLQEDYNEYGKSNFYYKELEKVSLKDIPKIQKMVKNRKTGEIELRDSRRLNFSRLAPYLSYLEQYYMDKFRSYNLNRGYNNRQLSNRSIITSEVL